MGNEAIDWRDALFLKREFLAPYLLLLLIFVISATTLILAPRDSKTFLSLTTSDSNYLGAATGIFLDLNLSAYIGELIWFLMVIVFLIATCLFCNTEQRRRRAWFFVICSFFIGVIGAEVWVILPHSTPYALGQSLVSFAAFGIVLGFAFTNLFSLRKQLKSIKTSFEFILVLCSPVVLGVMLYEVIFATNAFFIVASGVDYIGHIAVFISGLAAWSGFWLTRYVFAKIQSPADKSA